MLMSTMVENIYWEGPNRTEILLILRLPFLLIMELTHVNFCSLFVSFGKPETQKTALVFLKYAVPLSVFL